MSEVGIHRLIGGIGLVISLAVYLLIPSQVSLQPIPGTGDLVRITPAAVPLVCSSAFLVIGILLIAGSFARVRRADRSPVMSIESGAWPKLAFTTLMLLAYAFSIELFGYLVATVLFLTALNLFFGTRGLGQLAIAVLVIPIAIYLFFSQVMLIPLPEGALIS